MSFLKKIFINRYRIKKLLTISKDKQKREGNYCEVGLWLINPDDLRNRDNLCNDYKNLIKGLDEESITTVNHLISHLVSGQPIKNQKVNILLDDYEKKTIQEVDLNFTKKILSFNEECFAYLDYFLPINHFEASVLYFKHGIDTLNDLNKIKNKNIIDVGGFIGDSAIVFSKYTDKNVYSFEPSDDNYSLMLKTIELNDSTNIIPVKKGLGSKNEILTLINNSSGSHISNDQNGEKIQITTLDDFVNDNNIDVGLIKVDIEGFEQEFLKGAINTIKNQKPTLLLSIYHNFDDFFYIKTIIESWNFGYKFRVYAPLRNPLFLETLLIAEI